MTALISGESQNEILRLENQLEAIPKGLVNKDIDKKLNSVKFENLLFWRIWACHIFSSTMCKDDEDRDKQSTLYHPGADQREGGNR